LHYPLSTGWIDPLCLLPLLLLHSTKCFFAKKECAIELSATTVANGLGKVNALYSFPTRVLHPLHPTSNKGIPYSTSNWEKKRE
jgi:hypothetical protein